jgi:hypothetical protein
MPELEVWTVVDEISDHQAFRRKRLCVCRKMRVGVSGRPDESLMSGLAIYFSDTEPTEIKLGSCSAAH